MSTPLTPELRKQYEALTAAAGWCDVGHRTQIEFTGMDCARFLHNLCTNDIVRLQPGTGCEAFVTNVQGKTVGYIYVFRDTDSIVVDTVPRQGESLMAHFDRYHIREDVQLRDQSASWKALLLSGQASPRLLADESVEVPAEYLCHGGVVLFGQHVSLRRVEITGATAFLISGEQDAVARISQRMTDVGAEPCGQTAFDMARIETGSPLFGRDISDQNLPQEVNRDDRAISFDKGCYLGQETVARIDALGHVNRTLRGVKFGGDDVPEAGSELRVGGQPAVRITSAAFSPKLDAPLALGYVRRKHSTPGTRLATDAGDVEVVSLPV